MRYAWINVYRIGSRTWQSEPFDSKSFAMIEAKRKAYAELVDVVRVELEGDPVSHRGAVERNREIRRRLALDETVAELAKEFKVSPAVIVRIRAAGRRRAKQKKQGKPGNSREFPA